MFVTVHVYTDHIDSRLRLTSTSTALPPSAVLVVSGDGHQMSPYFVPVVVLVTLCLVAVIAVVGALVLYFERLRRHRSGKQEAGTSRDNLKSSSSLAVEEAPLCQNSAGELFVHMFICAEASENNLPGAPKWLILTLQVQSLDEI